MGGSSKIGVTPKSSILNYLNIVFHYKPSSYWGNPIYGNLLIMILVLTNGKSHVAGVTSLAWKVQLKAETDASAQDRPKSTNTIPVPSQKNFS